MLQPDTLLNGRYRLQEPVGEGGMATVYRAVDTRLGRTVAIKLLHPHFARDEPFLQRFQQEAEFAASLGAHPNIVDIYDIGEDNGLHYLVMEYVDGRSLKELIEERAPFGVPEAFSIGWQVASALDFAHKRGLIHRDVKPQNILVTPDGVAKVTDFGIARTASASQLTRTGMVIGTVHYFAPEQARGEPATPASDIYALGVILYEMLTGHLPFDADTPIGVAMQHVHSQPPSPWDYNPSLPARAVATMMRALEKDPELRYRDAAEFAAALSEGASEAMGETTVVSQIPAAPPVVRQQTATFEPVETTLPLSQTAVREQAVAHPVPAPQRSLQRTALLGLGLLLLAAALAAASFLVTSHGLLGAGGGKPTATPTVTPKPTPKRKRHRPTATPPLAVVIPPTPTPTPQPLPTWTPRPLPTWTPTPKPPPTQVPVATSPPPTPFVVPTIPGPVATETPAG